MKDPKDRSDSKLGPTAFHSAKMVRKQSGDSQYQKSTHRANSSVHSREGILNTIGQSRHLPMQMTTPDPISLKHNTISVRLNNEGLAVDQSVSSLENDNHPHNPASLTVQPDRKRDF